MPGTDASNLVLMGRIGAAHGVRGEVRIQSFCANPLDIAGYGPLATRQAGQLTIIAARMQKNMVVARLAGVTDRAAAERLNGTELFVARDRLPAEDGEDDFYIADLIGLRVRLKTGVECGTVRTIDNFGAGDVIEIGLDQGGTALFAFTRQNVPEIHIDGGYLIIDPPAEIEAREEDAE